jgi:hypothetical protein
MNRIERIKWLYWGEVATEVNEEFDSVGEVVLMGVFSLVIVGAAAPTAYSLARSPNLAMSVFGAAVLAIVGFLAFYAVLVLAGVGYVFATQQTELPPEAETGEL